MSEKTLIKTILLKHDYFPDILSLNPRFDSHSNHLKASIEIIWEEKDQRAKIESIIPKISAISETIQKHQCSEADDYLPFDLKAKLELEEKSFEGKLALAHLIEHLTIDFFCFITEIKKCSGVTCALWDPKNRFDLFIECMDELTGKFSFFLAVHAIHELIQNKDPVKWFKNILKTSRYCYQHRSVPISHINMANSFRWDEEKAKNMLQELASLGFVEEESYTISFSSIPAYRLARGIGHKEKKAKD